MQGVILIGLQKFVCDRFGEPLWKTIQHDARIESRVYLPSHSYPGEDLVALAASLSRHSGMSTQLVLESFGDVIAEDLVRLYGAEIDPRWKLLDVLGRADEIIERVAMQSGGIATRSPITGRFGRDGEVVLSYHAKLPLCALVKGVVHGLGATLEQPVVMEEQRCMAMGATSCEFLVRPERERQAPPRRRLTPPPISVAAIKAAMLGDRSGDRPSSPPSMPPPSMPPSMPPSSKGDRAAPSGVRGLGAGRDPTTIPPSSGVTMKTSPSQAPAKRISEPPKSAEDPEIARRR